ncbi:efflux RND transporter periplasmic adaptor subunit [Microbulbifer sp. SA54]|uniref:efflux RND transporter periplasmic adaptor subunit n=1 Tax=Microbulbifer sp. SA54 TaxID=3401577 RepID=UPI003AAB27AD
MRAFIPGALLLLTCLWGITALPQENPEMRTGTPITVEAVIATRQPLLEEVPVSGTIHALQQAMLSSEVSGLIQAIHTDVGRKVDKGALLLSLDEELNRISRDAALAEVTRVQETLTDSRRRLQELRALVRDRHVAETEVASLASEVREREALLRAAHVEAERQSALLRRHQIYAPFSGTVSLRQVDVGEWVEPGTALFELVATDALRADFQVPQRYFARIQPDTKIPVKLDNGRTITTRVEHRVPVSRSDGRTFLLRTTIAEKNAPGTQLIPGMSASATLQLTQAEQGIAVPRDAVLRYPDGRVTVWVAGEGSQWGQPVAVSEQQITTGLSFDDLVEVRSGLAAGQRVVVRGNESLQPGQTVILKQAAR